MRCLAIAVSALAIVATPALAEKKPQPTGLELQQIQSRDYEHGPNTVFPAVMSVLQDSGYMIQSADKDTGLITAQASTESKTNYNLFWGFGKKKLTPIVSAFIDQRGPNLTKVRLNFVLSKTKSRIYGMSSADEEMITDPVVYRDAFEKIDKAIFVRTAVDGAGAPAAATAPAAAPAAPMTTPGTN